MFRMLWNIEKSIHIHILPGCWPELQKTLPYHTESVSQPVDNSKPKQLFWKKNIIFCEAGIGTVKMIFFFNPSHTF